MSNHTPKLPSETELMALRDLIIDIVHGKVYNKKGKEIGSPGTGGWIKVCLTYAPKKSRFIFRGHIIWWKAKGYWPTKTIDHDNRIRHDDRIDNLKEATMHEQAQNHSMVLNKKVKPSKPIRPSYGAPWRAD